MGPKLSRTIADLKPGDHLCCLYSTAAEHCAALIPFLRNGFELAEKVVYVSTSCTPDTFLLHSQQNGFDLKPYLNRGQLRLFGFHDTTVMEQFLDLDGIIGWLNAEMERAQAEGYLALRLVREVSEMLGRSWGTQELIASEDRLNEFLPSSCCLCLCQYDKRRLDAATLTEVLNAHPTVVLGSGLYDEFSLSGCFNDADSCLAEARFGGP